MDSAVLALKVERAWHLRRIADYELYTDNVYQIITNQGKELARYAKLDKKANSTWGIGAVAGYGYNFGAEIRRAPFVGIAIYKTIIKF